MVNDLFSKPPKYTIDTSALIEIFDGAGLAAKKYTPGLWDKILVLINDGTIISHIEVLQEIRKDKSRGEELYDWAQANKFIFKDYDVVNEGPIIRSMSAKYKAFVNAKIKSVHADPWLIGQAKCKNIKIISEETWSNSSNFNNYRLPNVCADPLFNIGCLNLVGLTGEQNWTFK